ncbi:MAG: HAMP domain-containing histidine kinase, partial [Chitinophagales bacterium]|nr:HAMP domain-containing histidine kinase [Chitinophagales bacterium]MDW8419488.1 HAMP domain-containing sensor histidine kinase [Chitinophagales bacterium]
MDVYARKTNLKLILLITGIIIGAATVLYTNHLAGKLANEEKHKANLWAQAIARKAKLVRYTKDLFTKLAAEERNKVNIYAQSTRLILKTDDDEVLNFFNDIITSNNDIPAILTDEKGNIQGARNIDLPDTVKNISNLPPQLLQEFSVYPPIIIDLKFSISKIYYKDSNLFTKLKQTLNDLVETFINEVVLNTASMPVILTDEKMNILYYGNLDSALVNDSHKTLKIIREMQKKHEPIVADLGEGVKRYIYYDDSATLKQLRVFPYIQLGIIGAFLLISYLAFSSARKAEQNLVWVGMAKETAHQLGTPISSLAGWVEYLRDTGALKNQEGILQELDSDVKRLTLVADRFSKIGSVPKLTPVNLKEMLVRNVQYMRKRASTGVNFHIHCDNTHQIAVNEQLFDWVLENIIKNSLDAMDGAGEITLQASRNGRKIYIDITDTGKGIPKSKFETIFEPGY